MVIATSLLCAPKLAKVFLFYGSNLVTTTAPIVGTLHTPEECSNFKKTKLAALDLVANPQIILPLRCILLQHYNPEKWKEFSKLEAHLEERKNTWIWRSHETNVQRVFHEFEGLAKVADLVQKVCGILDVNSFEVRPPEIAQISANPDEFLRGVYLEAALMTHDCVGNTHLAIDDGFKLVVHAARDVGEGETIFFNYSNALLVRDMGCFV